MSRRSHPFYRRTLVRSSVFFGLVVFVGVGWALRAGVADPVSRWGWFGPTIDRAPITPDRLTSADHATVRQAAQGAIVGRATALSGDTLSIDGNVFRLWGVRAFAGEPPCPRDAIHSGCGQTPLSTLQSLADGVLVACYPRGIGITGVETAQCRHGSSGDLGTFLVSAGMADTVREETMQYELSRKSARDTQRGYWRPYHN